MAKSNKIAVITNLVLIVVLLVIVSTAESRGIGLPKEKSGPSCDKVYGVVSGDTCFDITNTFNLNTTFFDSINPNLDCDSLFVGQWLCLAGKP